MFKNSKRALIAALAVAAAAAPTAASARLNIADHGSGPAASAQPVAGTAHQGQTSGSTSAFDWGDAGIGAAAAVALMGGGTLAVAGRRGRGHTARAS